VNFTIIAPCFNEEESIPDLVDQFSDLLKNRTNVKLLIVNNGSTDNSKEILDRLCERESFLESIHIEKNIGYGNGVVAGLRSTKSEFVTWMYGDLQSRPVDTVKAIEMMEDEGFPKDLYIKGTRRGRPFFDQCITLMMSIIESIYFRTILYDINSSPSLFHRDFLNYWDNPPDDHSLDLYAYSLAKNYNLRMRRFGVEYPPRVYGVTSWNYGLRAKFVMTMRFLKYSIKLKEEIKNFK